MSDKDEFTFFDDKDDAPQSDLKSLFDDAEADSADSTAGDDPHLQDAGEPAPAEPAATTQRANLPLSRIVLLAILLLVVCAAGIFYFMQLGETPPAPVASKPKPARTVAVPPKPAGPDEAAVAQVPPPPPQSAQNEQAGAVETAPAAGEIATTSVVTDKAPEVSKPDAAAETAVVTAAAGKANEAAAKPTAAAKPVTDARQPAATTVTEEGAFTLDAGTFLLARNRDKLLRQLRALGFTPQTRQVEVQVTMTRLHLGVYPDSEVSQVLQQVKKISSGAFSMAATGGRAVYAGTFVEKSNVARLENQLAAAGFQVRREPVELPRTLDRIICGQYAEREAAEQEAARLAATGIEVSVVNR
ncbi:MAG: SPOR domain-containing protein [Desulfuromonadales bacterium]|nr:SPOR domain-containing protein [Desulfuromonadales bacterium]